MAASSTDLGRSHSRPPSFTSLTSTIILPILAAYFTNRLCPSQRLAENTRLPLGYVHREIGRASKVDDACGQNSSDCAKDACIDGTKGRFKTTQSSADARVPNVCLASRTIRNACSGTEGVTRGSVTSLSDWLMALLVSLPRSRKLRPAHAERTLRKGLPVNCRFTSPTDEQPKAPDDGVVGIAQAGSLTQAKNGDAMHRVRTQEGSQWLRMTH